MIPIELARELAGAGVRWDDPAPGDRFVIPDRDMDDQVFVVSSMVVDVHDFPTGQVLGFNGTVEWALDSVDRENALWMPSETQLRDLLGATFSTLVKVGDRFRVGLDVNSRRVELDGESAEAAYGRALLYLAAGS